MGSGNKDKSYNLVSTIDNMRDLMIKKDNEHNLTSNNQFFRIMIYISI